MILFENFYYDVVDKTKRAADDIRAKFKAGKYSFVDDGIKIKTNFEGVNYFLLFVFKMYDPETALAYITQPQARKTVKIKSGESRRRQMPIGNAAIININIANQIKKFKYLRNQLNTAIGENYKKYIYEMENGGYNFKQNIPNGIIKQIMHVFITSEYFDRELAHEMQHYYDPRAHNWMPKIRKQEIQPGIKENEKLTKRELQKYINYLASDAEVNSAIAETAMHVVRVKTPDELFKKYDAKSFVDQSIAFLEMFSKWQQYSTKIQRKVAAKLNLIYNALRDEHISQRAGK